MPKANVLQIDTWSRRHSIQHKPTLPRGYSMASFASGTGEYYDAQRIRQQPGMTINKELEQLSPKRRKRKKKKKRSGANSKISKPSGPFESFYNIPSLRQTQPGVAQSVLVKRKLHALCKLFDFSTPSNELGDTTSSLPTREMERDAKKDSLMEIFDHAKSNAQFFHGPNTAAMIRMISANLFRDDRISYHFPDYTFASTTAWHYASKHEGLNDASEAVNVKTLSSSDVAASSGANLGGSGSSNVKLCKWWAHQQIVYEIFLAFIVSDQVDGKIIKRYVHRNFLRYFVDLIRSGDPGERSYIKAILHRIYEKAVSYRKFIRRCMDYAFLAHIDDGGLHPAYPGLDDLLEIYFSIIDGFKVPLKEEHYQFYNRVLLPLHKTRFYSNIKPSVVKCK